MAATAAHLEADETVYAAREDGCACRCTESWDLLVPHSHWGVKVYKVRYVPRSKHSTPNRRANSDEPTREIQETVMLDCRSSLIPQESLTTTANKPQSIDGGDTCIDLNQNTNIYNDIDENWITNHLLAQPSPQAASNAPQEIYNEVMSIDDEHSAGDTGTTASSSAESDANELDD
jgi:hypothetical protein